MYVIRLLVISWAVQSCQIALVFLITHALKTSVDGLFQLPVSTLFPLVLPAFLCAFAVYSAGVRYFEHRSVDELRLNIAIPHLVLGVSCAVLLFAAVFAAIAASVKVSYIGYTGFGAMPAAALLYGTGVVFEEFVFRGAIYRITEEACGTAAALAISVVLFGASHLWNSGTTLFSLLSIAAGSITFCLAYSLTRSLWCPIGIHFGWNLAQGALFGAAVSGHASLGAFKFSLSGPDWVTGGAFGPEASIYSALLFGILAIGLGRLTMHHGRWRHSRFIMSAKR